MLQQRSGLAVVGMVLAAVAGGAISHWLLCGRGAFAQEPGGAPQVLRAQALVIVDAEGKERLMLGVRPEGAGILVRGPDGKEQVVLGVTPKGGAGLSLNDTEGKQRIGLGFDAEGGGLFLMDANGVSRVDVGLSPDSQEGGFALNGANGDSRVSIGMGPQNVGVTLCDDEGKDRLGLGLGPGGGGDFYAKDHLGNNVWRALGQVGPPAVP